jgi:hypothetical protein
MKIRCHLYAIFMLWNRSGGIFPERETCTINDSNLRGLQEGRTHMKRVGVWAIGMGLVVTVLLLTVAPGDAEEKGGTPSCTLATLKGRYLFGGIATLLPPAVPEQSLLAVAGYHIFNGDGTGIDIVTAIIDGVSVENNLGDHPDRSRYDISYTVNSDCSGTYTVHTVPPAPPGPSFGIFIAPNGEELTVIGTTPGFILVQGPNRRVSSK